MTDSPFTDRDLEQMRRIGISVDVALQQLELFRNLPPATRLDRQATLGDGVAQLPPERHPELLARYEEACGAGQVVKFVPSSGAATRMFKSLATLLVGEEADDTAREFVGRLDRFPFYDDLAAVARQRGVDLDGLRQHGDARGLAELVLEPEGLNYGHLPKGLIPFHRYPEGARTPVEEHLVEAAAYVRDRSHRCRVHFTIVDEHEEEFRSLLAEKGPLWEERLGVRFEVAFSGQAPVTNTLAVDLDDNPFRLEDGSVLFRPGGHGALIENMNDLARSGVGLILLKNIDNVVTEDVLDTTTLWKKLLGGRLLELREVVFGLVERLEDPAAAGDEALLAEAAGLLAETFYRPLPEETAGASPEERRRALLAALDRPLRVCGMVIFRGEPGGGPYWVESRGRITPQVVEYQQIDHDDPQQRAIFEGSTHFNPVDLACCLHDRHGRPYDLKRYIDPDTVFIAERSYHGRPLKALELPGLWNGAMAEWNSELVEVPLETFAPVKTVIDLLREEHQPKAATVR